MYIVLVGHIVDIVLVGLAVHTMLCFRGIYTFSRHDSIQSVLYESTKQDIQSVLYGLTKQGIQSVLYGSATQGIQSVLYGSRE